MPASPPLLAGQRQERIVAAVGREGGVRVSDLVGELGVSDMTVRRDIAALERAGRLQRVHGGAVALRRGQEEAPFAQARALQRPQKRAIATAALARVRPGATVALSGGSTTLALAEAIAALPHAGGLTVVTNSLPAADALARTPGPTVLLTGGERTPSEALVGPLAERACEGLHTDVLFLGAGGLDADAGPTTPNIREATITEALARTAREVVVMADSTKWGVVGLRTLLPWTAVDAVITDSGLPPAAHDFLTRSDLTLETVTP